MNVGGLNQKNRIIELDILRGIACIIVVMGHYLVDVKDSNSSFYSFVGLGGKGVWLFFMISGFVIFMTLEKVKRPLDFVVSRFSRLYPAYWFAVIFCFTLIHLFQLREKDIGFFSSMVNMSMFQSFVGVANLDKVYWTLAVELLFYGWMFLLFLNKSLRNIDYFLLTFLLISVVFVFLYPQYNTSSFFNYFNKFLILDHIYWFALGIVFYKLYAYKKLHGVSVAVLMLSIIVMALRSYSTPNCLINLSVVLVFGVILFCKIYRLMLLEFIGIISYSLYLIHSIVGDVVLPQLTMLKINSNITVLLTLSLAVLIASAITFLIEMPARKKIRQIYYNLMPSRQV